MNEAQKPSPDDMEYISPGPEPTQDDLLALAREGAEAWNAWREKYPVTIDKETQEPKGPRADFFSVDFTSNGNEEIDFSGFQFGHYASFGGAKFGDGASFRDAKFGKHARFRNAIFADLARFDHASFGDGARFNETVFGKRAGFTGATFGNAARFVSAKFGDAADFTGAKFGIEALFEGAVFGESASFHRATFGEEASFKGATLGYGSFFLNATFGDRAWFNGRTDKEDAFSVVSFTGSRFLGYASFARRTFNASADFDNTSFKQPPDFSAIRNPENLNWTGMKVGFAGAIGRLRTPGWLTRTEPVTQLRRLRRIASDIHANDAERDLFIAERKAERGVLWKAWWRRKRDLAVLTKAARNTLLLFLYSLSSNCGRSVLLPLFWLAVSSSGFWAAYDALAVEGDLLPVGDSGESIGRTHALLTFTGSRFLPFFGSSFAAAEGVESALFAGTVPSGAVQVLAAGQGVLNAILLFLLALALRNHFRVG